MLPVLGKHIKYVLLLQVLLSSITCQSRLLMPTQQGARQQLSSKLAIKLVAVQLATR